MGRQAPSRVRIPPSPLQIATATLVARFAAPVAQLDRASVYGTEGQRFESSRARSTNPSAVGVFRLVANAAGWQQRGQRGNNEQVAPRADRGAGHLPAWFEERGGLPRRGSSTQAVRPHAGRGSGDQG